MASNLLKDALVDVKTIKEAAYKNAEAVLMEHLKEDVKKLVEESLNEEEEVVETEQYEEGANMEENEAVTEEMDFEEDGEDEGDVELDLGVDDEDGDELEEGFTEADIHEAIAAALNEVEHGSLGDMEEVDPDTHDSGLLDQDMKEDGWENKTPPKAKDQYSAQGVKKEAAALKAKVAKLVAENMALKKANKALAAGLNEVKLFNAKLWYASKLLQKENLSAAHKKQILAKMDSVGSLAEAKNLYESLEMALGLVSEAAKKQTKSKKPSLTEALGSGTGGKGVSRVDDSHLMTESKSPFDVNRMQVLAGLKKE